MAHRSDREQGHAAERPRHQSLQSRVAPSSRIPSGPAVRKTAASTGRTQDCTRPAAEHQIYPCNAGAIHTRRSRARPAIATGTAGQGGMQTSVRRKGVVLGRSSVIWYHAAFEPTIICIEGLMVGSSSRPPPSILPLDETPSRPSLVSTESFHISTFSLSLGGKQIHRQMSARQRRKGGVASPSTKVRIAPSASVSAK